VKKVWIFVHIGSLTPVLHAGIRIVEFVVTDLLYVACSRSIRRDSPPPPRGNYWSTGGVLWEEGGEYLHAHTWIFSRQQTASVACSQRVSGSVYTARVALLFSAKMTERLEQRYCIKICQKLGDSQVENIRKIQRVFGDDAMGITQIKSGTTDSKMAARRWRVTLVPVGPRQAEMTSSMTKCGLWSCRTVVSPFENLRRRWE